MTSGLLEFAAELEHRDAELAQALEDVERLQHDVDDLRARATTTAERLEMLIDDYYRFLGWSAFPRRGEEFWQFHRKILLQAGHPLSRLRLLKAILGRVLSAVVNPKRSIEGAWQWFSHETS